MITFDQMHDDCGSCVYWGERGHWLVCLGQHRDSDTLERSNFAVACKSLEELDPDCYAVESESHWAVGWVEHLLIDPTNAAAVALAEGFQEQLEDYPILDEDHFSQVEWDEYLEAWGNWIAYNSARGRRWNSTH